MKPSKKPMLTRSAIARRVSELAEAISKHFTGREIVVVPVLKGGLVFASDLMRQLDLPVTVDFIRARSYGGERSRGTVEFLVLPTDSLADRHVLIVEDILDSGRTTAAVLDRLQAEKPASLRLCVLLEKQVQRRFDVRPDYVGFEIDDRFVVGYGLDYNERFRELPSIHLLEEE